VFATGECVISDGPTIRCDGRVQYAATEESDGLTLSARPGASKSKKILPSTSIVVRVHVEISDNMIPCLIIRLAFGFQEKKISLLFQVRRAPLHVYARSSRSRTSGLPNTHLSSLKKKHTHPSPTLIVY
jgi:hypothetical protein